MTDNLDFSFDFGGADLDFDLGDFEVVDSDDGFSIDDRSKRCALLDAPRR